MGGATKRREGWVTDSHKLAQRQKQIDFGKATAGYRAYVQSVPKSKRSKQHPKTPDIHADVSKRRFDGRLRQWRRALHRWDPAFASTARNAQPGNHDAKPRMHKAQRVLISSGGELEAYDGDDELVCSQEMDHSGCVHVQSEKAQCNGPAIAHAVPACTNAAANNHCNAANAAAGGKEEEEEEEEEEPVFFGVADDALFNSIDSAPTEQASSDAFEGGQVINERLPPLPNELDELL